MVREVKKVERDDGELVERQGQIKCVRQERVLVLFSGQNLKS